ncbi:MAG TPA: hypothetical protein ENG92_05530 [Thiolapillus brandeum]|uniref:Phage shock protein B n=1 Tax=Thiolapillus brandeum TaxID=1076588 RepID=A0A831KCR9_9GAMM|nr:hypothetical protein [Thiolapillus brandeum]
MNPFEMAVIIVGLAILGGVIKHYFDIRGNQEASSGAQSQLQDRLAKVEERLQVLERIVTSSDYELKRKFRDLEDDEKL